MKGTHAKQRGYHRELLMIGLGLQLPKGSRKFGRPRRTERWRSQRTPSGPRSKTPRSKRPVLSAFHLRACAVWVCRTFSKRFMFGVSVPYFVGLGLHWALIKIAVTYK